jgi:hypothetical protein
VREHDRILLANLFQASKANISAREFPGSSMFKEGGFCRTPEKVYSRG